MSPHRRLVEPPLQRGNAVKHTLAERGEIVGNGKRKRIKEEERDGGTEGQRKGRRVRRVIETFTAGSGENIQKSPDTHV